MNRLHINWNFTDLYYLLFSFLGLLFLVFLLVWIPPSPDIFNLQKTLIFSLFSLICFLGMIAAFYPASCSRSFIRREENELSNDYEHKLDYCQSDLSKGGRNKLSLGVEYKKIFSTEFKGHHPVCGEFASHTINWQGKKYCAGCTGLIVGAILTMTGSLIYILSVGLDTKYGVFFLIIGLGCVFISLMQMFVLKIQHNLLKFFINIILVIGSLLILIGLDTMINNLFIEFYFLILIIFWILARTRISQQDHGTICKNCKKQSVCHLKIE